MRAQVLLLAVVLTLLSAPPLRAQPEPSQNPFPRGNLQAALEESIRTKRILVVFLNRPGLAWRKVEENTLTNRTLEAWMMWHGVGVNLDAAEDASGHAAVTQALERERRRTGGRINPDVFPTFLFFVNGKLARIYPDPQFHAFFFENPLGLPGGPADPAVFYPKATQLLFTADFLMDKLASTQPVWTAMHKELNPPPQAPDFGPPICFREDDSAPCIFDPEEGDDLLEVLERARDALAIGGLRDATGYYSWLWERSAEIDPAFRGVRRGFLAAEIAEVCRREPASARRFEAHRKRLGDRFLWWAYIDWVDWMALNEVLNVEGENLKLLATPLLDEQEATMLPRADYAAFQTMLGLGDFTRPEQVTARQVQLLRKLAVQTAATAPPGTPDEEWRAMLTFRRQMLVDEGSRIHAALLRRGQQQEAEEVARLVIAHADHPGASRLSLVITALVAGVEPTPQFEKWVLEAAEHGESRPWLLRRLRSGAAAAGSKP